MIDLTKEDKRVYEEELKGFLPDKIIDVHTHCWENKTGEDVVVASQRSVQWVVSIASSNTVEELDQRYQDLFPGKEVRPLLFPNLPVKDGIDTANNYIKEAASRSAYPSLLLAAPEWSGDELLRKLKQGGFLGIKVYFTYVADYLPQDELRIYDYLPHHQLEVLNEHGLICILHIPRSGRLKDPVNLAQMAEIDERYPNAKIIIAHVGRAYCPEDVGDAFETVKKTRNLYYDFTANTSDYAIEELIKHIDTSRILFGSDLPITLMRMHRICENGNYINLVPKGLYPGVDSDPHIREVPSPESDTYTLFIYESILAFKRAAERRALSRDQVEQVFYRNAKDMIDRTKAPI